MKLELKHITPYIGHNLQAMMLDHRIDYVGKEIDTLKGLYQWDKSGELWAVLTEGGSKPSLDRIKPLLRPISDVTKEITHNGETFYPMDKLLAACNFDVAKMSREEINEYAESTTMFELLSYLHAELLASWHFDIFNLIPNNLAEILIEHVQHTISRYSDLLPEKIRTADASLTDEFYEWLKKFNVYKNDVSSYIEVIFKNWEHKGYEFSKINNIIEVKLSAQGDRGNKRMLRILKIRLGQYLCNHKTGKHYVFRIPENVYNIKNINNI